MKYFDKENDRLVFTGRTASPDFWDSVWNVEDLKRVIEGGIRNRLIINTTKKYLEPKKSIKILEAGCGNGQFVYAFDMLGYDSYGVDYAADTVLKAKSIFPELKIRVEDVRKMNFPDNHFDGYWSIGVIEHFYEGYDSIINEMKRILKPGGYLFISFPHMSLLRKLKVKLGFYPEFKERVLVTENFYQFALCHDKVISKLEDKGFILLQKSPYSGTKGLKDEVNLLKPLLQKTYNSPYILLKMVNYGLSLVLSGFSSHAILLVLKKND